MAAMQDRYDSAFLGILQNEEKIEAFLDVTFGFLFRKTDFYHILADQQGKTGFPPGVAKKIIDTTYEKYEGLSKQRTAMLKSKLQSSKQKKKEPKSTKSRQENGHCKMDVTSDLPSESAATAPDITPVKQNNLPMQKEDSRVETDSAGEVGNKPSGEVKDTPQEPSAAPPVSASGDETADDNNPELTRQQALFQDNPESYNGAIRDNYSWSQQIKEVDVKVMVPKYIVKGKDVQVTIGRKRLKVAHMTPEGSWMTVVDDELTWEVRIGECLWNMEPGKYVQVDLEKVQERWWEAVFVSEPKISVRKIDPSRPMTDLDDEAQAKIEEMMYNDHMKKLGKPQSHEKKVHNMLEKAWDVEGSPFRGQPFDPSKLNISSGNSFDFNNK